MNTTSDDPSLSEAHGERRDFDDGANGLWSLYGKVAQTHDEAYVQSLAKDMDGLLVFVRFDITFFLRRLQLIYVYSNRLVYFQLFSLPSSFQVFRICRWTPRSNPYTTSSNQPIINSNPHISRSSRLRFWPRSHNNLVPSLQRFPPCLPSHPPPNRFSFHPLPLRPIMHSSHHFLTSE